MILNEIIQKREDGTVFVSARDLHEWLGSTRNFENWNNQNLLNASYGLIDCIEFNVKKPNPLQSHSDYLEVVSREVQQVVVKLAKNKGTTFENKMFIDYELSLRVASHLAMVSKCKRGREARNYFFEIEQEYTRQVEANLKLGSMLLTHKEKLNLTRELFYPILEKLGVIANKKNKVHQQIIKALFGKYENLNKLTKLTDEDIENYKRLAISMQHDTRNFIDKNQVTIWDIITEL